MKNQGYKKLGVETYTQEVNKCNQYWKTWVSQLFLNLKENENTKN